MLQYNALDSVVLEISSKQVLMASQVIESAHDTSGSEEKHPYVVACT